MNRIRRRKDENESSNQLTEFIELLIGTLRNDEQGYFKGRSEEAMDSYTMDVLDILAKQGKWSTINLLVDDNILSLSQVIQLADNDNIQGFYIMRDYYRTLQELYEEDFESLAEFFHGKLNQFTDRKLSDFHMKEIVDFLYEMKLPDQFFISFEETARDEGNTALADYLKSLPPREDETEDMDDMK